MNACQKAVELVSRERIERIYNDLDTIGRNGKKGITRLAYSRAEEEAYDYFINQISRSRIDLKIDYLGNLFSILKGREKQIILSGSHLDSVKTGGNADGGAGCVAALEALTCISDSGIELNYSVGFCAIRAEESDRFGQALVGSKGIFRKLSDLELKSKDDKGKTLEEAIKKSKDLRLEGYNRQTDYYFPTQNIKCFIELHPEQSYVLEQREKQIGIVDRIVAPERWKFIVEGRRDHSGATPMIGRQDANQGMAEMVNLIERIASENPSTVATVGKCSDIYGSINTISGKAYFTVDCRDDDEKRREKVMSEISKNITDTAKKRNLKVKSEFISRSNPVSLDLYVTSSLVESCEELGINYMMIRSGASHDAATFQNNGIPSGMIFIPSINGISHAPDEKINIDDLYKGTQVLVATMLKLGEDK